jgi:tRNA pseudouridine55 synthase
LDKPAGRSSNQALQQAKRLFGAAKAGHAGTLDPFAVGLLPLLFGEATKFASYSSDAGKGYDATIVLGTRTNTGDTTGFVIEERPVDLNERAIEQALAAFRGRLLQTPPMYSALKHGGEPLYKKARRGEEVSREPREIEISKLELKTLRGNLLDVAVECSKGTYIRVLAEDLGKQLGCGGTLAALRRTRVGDFLVEHAHSLASLEAMEPQARAAALLPVDASLSYLPAVTLSEEETRRIKRGQPIALAARRPIAGTARLYREDQGQFLGLATAEDGWLRPRRLVLGLDPS